MSLPTLPLRRWILWPLVATFVLAVMVLALFARGAAQTAARDLGRAHAAEIGQRIEDPLAAELTALARRVEVNAEAMAQGRLPADEPLDGAPWLYDQLRQAPHLTFLSFAWPDGRYLGAVRLPEGDDAVHLSANFLEAPFTLVGYLPGRDGRPASPDGREPPKAYDPRARSFFQRAVARGATAWGEVESYVGWRAFGIGVSTPVLGDDGRLLAVSGGAIALERLADVLQGLALPDGGVAFVVDAQGRLVASSQPMPLALGEKGRAVRIALADAPHPAAARLAMLMRRPDVASGDLDAGGVEYLYHVRRLRAPAGLGWRIAVVLPASVSLEPLRLGERRLLVLMAVMMATVLALGLALSRAVVRPVERLGAAAARGHLDELARRDAADSPVLEVGRLSRALGDLSSALQGSIAALEQRVAERTAELEEANRRLHDLSLHDPLTGIGNRRAFDEALAREWAGAVRRGHPLALAVVDIDHFKALNDRYGHPTGDAVLREITRRLSGVVRRGTDLAARLGGEEFALLLPDTGLDEARALAELARRAVGETGIDGIEGRVTVSIGVAAVIPSPGDEPTALVAAADAMLYAAKSAGRDRVCA